MPSHAIRIGGKEDYDRIVSGGLPYGGATTQPVPIGPDGLPIVFPIVPSVFLPPGLAKTPGVPVQIGPGGLPYGGATTQPVPIGPDGLPLPTWPGYGDDAPPLAIDPGGLPYGGATTQPVPIGPDGLPIKPGGLPVYLPGGPPVLAPHVDPLDPQPLIPPEASEVELLLFPEQEAGLLPGLPESLIPSPETVKKAGEGLRLVQQILLVGFLYGLFKNMLAKRDESLDLES